MATTNQAKKGRLELVLDEFSEVHGTVLLGMHKELQTLKEEVLQRVEAQIAQTLRDTRDAHAALQLDVQSAQEVSNSLSAKERELTRVVEQSKKEAMQSVAQAGDESIARVKATDRSMVQQAEGLISQIEQRLAALKHLESQTRTAIEGHLAQSKSVLDAFAAEANRLKTQINLVHKVANESISEAKSAVQGMKHATEKLLNETRAERETLHQREVAFQNRTQKTLIAMGILIAATIGVWIWLSMKA